MEELNEVVCALRELQQKARSDEQKLAIALEALQRCASFGSIAAAKALALIGHVSCEKSE